LERDTKELARSHPNDLVPDVKNPFSIYHEEGYV
jgi:hypothetical protein